MISSGQARVNRGILYTCWLWLRDTAHAEWPWHRGTGKRSLQRLVLQCLQSTFLESGFGLSPVPKVNRKPAALKDKSFDLSSMSKFTV